MQYRTYLRVALRVLVVRRFVGHLLKHLMEAHEDDGVALDEILELLDDRVEGIVDTRRMLDVSDHLSEPIFQDVVVIGKPATKTMLHPTWLARLVILVRL